MSIETRGVREPQADEFSRVSVPIPSDLQGVFFSLERPVRKSLRAAVTQKPRSSVVSRLASRDRLGEKLSPSSTSSSSPLLPDVSHPALVPQAREREATIKFLAHVSVGENAFWRAWKMAWERSRLTVNAWRRQTSPRASVYLQQTDVSTPGEQSRRMFSGFLGSEVEWLRNPGTCNGCSTAFFFRHVNNSCRRESNAGRTRAYQWQETWNGTFRAASTQLEGQGPHRCAIAARLGWRGVPGWTRRFWKGSTEGRNAKTCSAQRCIFPNPKRSARTWPICAMPSISPGKN